MEFTFNDEQEALRDAVRGLLGKRYGAIENRRRATASDPGFDEKVWAEFAELGLLALPFSEEDGGLGAGPTEVAVVAEELGRVLAPEPYVETVILAGSVVAGAGSDEQRVELLGALGEGSVILAFAHDEPGSRWAPSATQVTASEAGGQWTLTGIKEPVIQGARADRLIVSAAVPEGTALFVVDGDAAGLVRSGYRTHDGGRAATIRLDSTPATPLGDGVRDLTDVIEAAQDRARVAYAHETLGAIEFLLDTTVDYLRSRKQFGVTLSTFQALTFRAADLYVAQELLRSTAIWATAVLDAAQEDGATVDIAAATSHALLQASKAGRLVGQDAIQLHGGIGMTAEYSVGHYTSRLVAIEHRAGDAAFHRARILRRLEDHDTFDPTE